MNKYSTATIIKAVLAAIAGFFAAATAASNGADITHLDFSQWLDSIGAAVLAGGALLHSPKSPDGTPVSSDPATTVVDVLTKTGEAHAALAEQAIANVAKVQDAIGELTRLLPAPVQQVAKPAEDLGRAILTDAQLAASSVNNLAALGPLAEQAMRLAARF